MRKPEGKINSQSLGQDFEIKTMRKKVLIAVRLCSSTLLLPSLFFFVCHSNDELSMRCSSGCKLSDLTETDTFEPCRLLMHSNKSFSLSRCITHKEPLRARKGSAQNNFTSLLKAEESKQIRNAHSQPPHKVAGVILKIKQRLFFSSFKVIPPRSTNL